MPKYDYICPDCKFIYEDEHAIKEEPRLPDMHIDNRDQSKRCYTALMRKWTPLAFRFVDGN